MSMPNPIAEESKLSARGAKRTSMKDGSRSKSGYLKDRSTLYFELNDYQKRLKADANS